jgi:hypothetical protein
MRLVPIVSALLLAACTSQPERVFVPGSPFRHVVEVRTAQGTSAEARVGEWITLHARRETGPWTNVDRKSLGRDGCWVTPPPPPAEAEVATDLSWRADPRDGEFDDGLADDRTRRVRFTKPGRYRLNATSSTWCSPKVESNELIVIVRP